MTQSKLNIVDKRMAMLPEILKKAGKIDYTKDFIETLGMSKQNYYAIAREGVQHFTVTQILIVCKAYSVDGNWLLGLHNESPFQLKQKLKQIQIKKEFITSKLKM